MAKTASRKRAPGARSPKAKQTTRRGGSTTRVATGRATTGRATAKRAATKRATAKPGTAKRATPKRATAKPGTAEGAATKRVSTKPGTAKRAAAKSAATGRAAGKQAARTPRAVSTRDTRQAAARRRPAPRPSKAGPSAKQQQSRLSKVATAVKGTVAGAVAAVARTVGARAGDAITLLEADHRRMEDLLKRGEATSGRAVKERDALLDTITAELRRHEQMEEEVLYPALAAHPEAKDIVAEGFQEHHLADVVVQELHEVATDTEQWQAKFAVLKENIEHHIDEEEGEMFRTARAIFSEDELEAMGSRMAEIKMASAPRG